MEQELQKLTPAELIKKLKKEGIKRFYFVYNEEEKKITSSHKLLQPLADLINNDKRDFEEHEGLFFQISENYNTLLGAFIHRTARGQAAGGVRYWQYNTVGDYIHDGLRLAKGMTHKNALAGLWWGGGKGVMAYNPDYPKNDPVIRASIYKEYGRFISSLNGCYVTAEDVGTNVGDMANIFAGTRFTTCIPAPLGGSGNPSVPTARGVLSGIEAALHHLGGQTLEGKTVAVQGMGNVGGPLIKFLFEKNVKKVIACDVSEEIVNNLKKELDGKNIAAKVVGLNDTSIFSEECDIFAPCATGAILKPATIEMLKAKIICGAANNQLEDPERDSKLLHQKGILYVPDFLANRMGIVNCANEQYGYVNNDPQIEKHLQKNWEYSVFQTSLTVFKKAEEANKTTSQIALELADKLSRQEHPVFGHRGKQIIASLVNNKWHESN